ncbi:MAG: cytosine permease, partial [Bifidobacteriaceae bacterium]|nr:cytosine permease [Bifidobacteriaceae bacterium]
VIAYYLCALGALLGPFFGILAVDYFLVRKQAFSIRDMYRPTPESIYFYNKGFNGLAVKAFVPAAIVSLSVALIPAFSLLAPFGWFIGAPIAAAVYYVIAKGKLPVEPRM